MQLPHWPVIKRYAFSADLSAYEAESINRSEAGEDSETLTAMAGLSVCRTDSSKSIALVTSPHRITYIQYGTYIPYY